MTQLVANLLKLVSITVPTSTDIPKDAVLSPVAGDNKTTDSISGLVSSNPTLETKTDPGVSVHAYKEKDTKTAVEELFLNKELCTTPTITIPEAATKKTKIDLKNFGCFLRRVSEIKLDKAALEHDIRLFKTETKHQIEKLEGEIEGFEEEIASRDQQILEQEERILEQNQRINALDEILQERKKDDLELEEAERTLMNAVFDLVTQRTSLKRQREDSEENEILPYRRKRRVGIEELQ